MIRGFLTTIGALLALLLFVPIVLLAGFFALAAHGMARFDEHGREINPDGGWRIEVPVDAAADRNGDAEFPADAEEAPEDPYDPVARFEFWQGLRRQHWDDLQLRKNPILWKNLDPFQQRDLEERLRDWNGRTKEEFDRERSEHPDLERLIEQAARRMEKVA